MTPPRPRLQKMRTLRKAAAFLDVIDRRVGFGTVIPLTDTERRELRSLAAQARPFLPGKTTAHPNTPAVEHLRDPYDL